MPMLKYGSASLIETNVSADDWANRVYTDACAGGKCRMKTAKSVVAKYDPSKYLLSHCSIIAAVDVDEADKSASEYKDYLIKPEYSKWVNNNGDAWTKELLKEAYKTFIGCNNYCFPGGTRVLMSDGTYKPIEDVKIGDKVINRKGEIAKVSDIFKRESSDLVEITGKSILSRSLFVTKEHPFWVYRARKTCPKTGRPNHFDKDKDFYHLDSWVGFSVGVHRASGEKYPCGITPDWVEAGDLDPSRDFFTHPVSNVEIENSEINENRAELIGWFLAEGSYMNTNVFSDRESGIVFHLGNNETDVAERLSKLLVQEFGQYLRVDCKPRIYETESGSRNLSVSNKFVSDFFMKWCGKYAWAKVLTEEAMWLPKNLQAIILHNCIHGDGTNKINSRGFVIELKSQKLIQQLMWISWRLGIRPTYKETGVLPRYSEMEIVDGYEIYIDPVTGKKSRPGYLLKFSTRDSKNLCKTSGYNDPIIAKRLSKRYTPVFESKEGKWIISKIENVINTIDVTCDVYNIKVDGDNSYIAEGRVVHNCEHVQIPELSKGKVIDAALREISVGKDKKGKNLTTYYVDILVATDRKHEDLVRKIQAQELNTLSMGCFLKGTEITTSDGTKRNIEEIRPGDSIITHNGVANTVMNIQRKWYEGNILALQVEGDYKTTYVTPEHPFWAFNREQECACGCGEKIRTKLTGHKGNFDGKDFVFSKYKQGHYARVVNPNKKVYSFEEYKKLKDNNNIKGKLDLNWIKAGNLKVGDLVSYPVSQRVYNDPDATIDKARLIDSLRNGIGY
jgi:hypothetical protein